MENAPGRYLAYMLRLWEVDGGTLVWRASLEDAHTGQRCGFGDLESLFQFLAEQTSRGMQDAQPGGKQLNRPRTDSNNSGTVV